VPPASSLQTLDPDPSYSVRLQARLSGVAHASLRVDLYWLANADPNESPRSEIVGSVEFPLVLPSDGRWQVRELLIPPKSQGGPERPANRVLLYLQLDPPAEGTALLDVDELTLIKWRRAAQMPARQGFYGFVRRDEKNDLVLNYSALPAQ